MHAALFYELPHPEACLLTWVSTTQWEKPSAHLKNLQPAAIAQGFRGKVGDIAYIPAQGKHPKTLLLGCDPSAWFTSVASIVTKLPADHYISDLPLPEAGLLAWSLAQYRFDRYKTSTAPVRCLGIPAAEKTAILHMTESIFLIRDIINTPTEDMGPAELTEVTLQVAKKHRGASVTVCEGEALLKMGYPAIYTVGRGAHTAPRLIHLSWGKPSHPLVVLIGKGVCFDTGGLDLKSSSGMRLMKKDKGGAAHVIGLANWIMEQQLPIQLQVLIPAVENAIGPNAYRPGDIIRMRNKLTVEIDNTDAEGRLILADALVKACEDKPALIMDFATLTGAARVAVGTEIAAFFSNHEPTATALSQASAKTNDPVWRLPLFKPYETMLESSIADLLNSSPSSYAGAITAALFLQRFVDPAIPWVHFDLMAWNVSNKPGKPEGGEAMAFLATVEYLKTMVGV